MQEEDFVSNLYHRNLLSNFEATDIENLLEDSIAYIAQREETKAGEVQAALASRLQLRKAFLLAVKPKTVLLGPDHAVLWNSCLELLPKLRSSKHLGVAVNNSFSAKIQRRLASSVPPRPIVEIGFDEAFVYLNQLFQNGKEVYRVLDHPDGCNWMVRRCRYDAFNGKTLITPEFRNVIPIADAAPIRVYSLSTPVVDRG